MRFESTIFSLTQIRRPAKIFNSIAVAKSGDIFWTDSSSDFDLEDGIFALLANPSGRLFQYNRSTKQNKVLIDELYFANGVALSPTEDFVVVAETAASRVKKYHLSGKKAGQIDVFIDRLPGAPDNLTPDADGIWVPLVMAADKDHPAIFHSAANAPLVRKFAARVLALIELPFKLIETVYPNEHTRWLVHKIGHFETVSVPPRSTIVRVDWNGKIVGSLHGFDKSAPHAAHVLEDGDHLYIGSFQNKFLARVKLPKTYKSGKTAPKVEPKVVTTTTKKPATVTTTTSTTTTTTTTPKPTTTTPKPKATTTTTTTPKPKPKPTTTPKPATAKPSATTAKPKDPAPIHENVADDAKRPKQEKLKVIKKGGAQGEL